MNILNKLTIKHLKMNKKRTIVTIVGVILSTALMVGIGLIFSSIRDFMIKDIISYAGDYHVAIQDVPTDKMSIITKNIKVKDYFYSKHLGYAYLENGQNEYKPYLNILTVSDNYFDELDLIEGRLPQDENEILISDHIRYNGGVEYSLGDVLKLQLGERYLDGEKVASVGFQPGEKLQLTNEKTYKIVGIVSRSVLEDYSEPGYSIFTKESDTSKNIDSKISVYLKYKNVKDTYKISENIAEKLGFQNLSTESKYYKEISYNDSLLAMYGVSHYDNIIEGISGILAITLGLISIGCIIVIYNSFAISVMERKKQFGLFSSIGATKHQLRKTVFFEAFIIGIIGIPLGLLSGFLGIYIVIAIVNNLIPNEIHFCLSPYPLFIIIPIIFMIVVIVVSAFIPAKRASKITPIEAIRLNDDIKIKGHKLKTNKLVHKVFGVEGDIALKNIKRNKKKYRITIVSLFISIVMFITFSSFIDYIFKGVDDTVAMPNYDIEIMAIDTISDEVISNIVNHEQVDQSVVIYQDAFYTNSDFSKITTDEYKELFANGYVSDDYNRILFIALDNDSFVEYINKLGYSKPKPVLLNLQQGITYKANSRKAYQIKKYKSNDLAINLYDPEYDEEQDKFNYKSIGVIDDYYLGNVEAFGTDEYVQLQDPVVIISKDMMENRYALNTYIMISAKKYDKLEKLLDTYTSTDVRSDRTDRTDKIQYVNYTEEMRMTRNIVLAVKILVYGFISLVTLIGVTSVFNTINTSIALRRKEFAMLRSVGLTPRGFNKILYLESLIIGLKSLLYSLPVSLILIILVHLSMSNITDYNNLILPIKSILIAVFSVFVIVIITMMYASSKIKHENILEAIREENI